MCAVVSGSQGNGVARTEPRLYANVPLRLLPVETQHAETQRAASLLMRPPLPAAIIHTPPVLEDTATVTYTRQRATLTLAGMTIAVHITDTSAPDDLIYVFADHLGSTSILADDSGTAIPGSTAHYLPFGDWRTEPAAAETSRWYTGHVHNNLGHNDLGLIYMNARFYLPGVARFVSADTIVPDATNPQQFNRYSYVLNQPTLLTDPNGHSCAAPINGSEDRRCAYLENDILDSTVIIHFDYRLVLTSVGGNDYLSVPLSSDSHATILDAQTLLTHNHFSVFDKDGVIDSLKILDSRHGNILYSGGFSTSLYRKSNGDSLQTRLLLFPQETFDTPYDSFANTQDYEHIYKGHEIGVVNWKTGEVGSTHIEWGTVDIPATNLQYGENSAPVITVSGIILQHGASGGGLYWQGKHVANNWISGDVVFGALNPLTVAINGD